PVVIRGNDSMCPGAHTYLACCLTRYWWADGLWMRLLAWPNQYPTIAPAMPVTGATTSDSVDPPILKMSAYKGYRTRAITTSISEIPRNQVSMVRRRCSPTTIGEASGAGVMGAGVTGTEVTGTVVTGAGVTGVALPGFFVVAINLAPQDLGSVLPLSSDLGRPVKGLSWFDHWTCTRRVPMSLPVPLRPDRGQATR